MIRPIDIGDRQVYGIVYLTGYFIVLVFVAFILGLFPEARHLTAQLSWPFMLVAAVYFGVLAYGFGHLALAKRQLRQETADLATNRKISLAQSIQFFCCFHPVMYALYWVANETQGYVVSHFLLLVASAGPIMLVCLVVYVLRRDYGLRS